MESLPTFTPKINQMEVNIPYMEHMGLIHELFFSLINICQYLKGQTGQVREGGHCGQREGQEDPTQGEVT